MNTLRYKERLALLAYLLAWLAPAICLVIVDFGIPSIVKLVVTVLIAIIWHFAFKNFLHSVYFSLLFFLLLPFDLFFFWIYREPPTTPVLLSIGNTNFGETVDFMRGRLVLLLVFVAAAVMVWLQTVRAAQRGVGAEWRCFNPLGRYLSRSFLVVLAVAGVIFTSSPALEHHFSLPETDKNTSFDMSVVDERVASVLVKLKGVFPVGRFISLGEYYREEANFRYAEQRKDGFRFNARQIDVPAQRQIYVLVIGETGRGDHSHLNGYVRDTSPLLAGQGNLVPLRNMVSPWSFTRLSVPTILTGQESSANAAQLKSVVSAFHEAGFKTYWLSNQQHENGIDYFAREADERIFINVSALVLERHGNYDERLLAPLEKLISRNEPRQFFVVHLLGSHDAYQKRYPSSFDVFQPSLTSKQELDYHAVQNKTEVINTYDNSMRYTDYVLSNIIATLEKRQGVSALVYSSDHGETLFDGSCQRSGHGSSGRQEFMVSALSWMSDEHRNHWPAKYQLMKEHGSTPITTEFVFDTMLGLANVSIDRPSPHRNLAGARFQPQQRWVHAQDRVDWDTADTKGSCNMLTASVQK